MAHVNAGCSALAQSKHLERHNAALKVLYFHLSRDLKLVDEVPPWYSEIQPKPLNESQDVQALWDIPVYAEHNEVRANRMDARIVNAEIGHFKYAVHRPDTQGCCLIDFKIDCK